MLSGMAFMVFGDDFTAMVTFPAGGTIHLQSWVYFVGQHLGLILLSLILAENATKYRTAFAMFFAVQVADLLDFIITGNKVWFHLRDIPVSMNTVGITLFCVSILKDYIDDH